MSTRVSGRPPRCHQDTTLFPSIEQRPVLFDQRCVGVADMDLGGVVGWGDNNDWWWYKLQKKMVVNVVKSFNSTSHQWGEDFKLIESIGPPGLHCRMDCPFFLCVTGSWGLGGRQGHTSSQCVGVACAIGVELSGGSVSSKILPFS